MAEQGQRDNVGVELHGDSLIGVGVYSLPLRNRAQGRSLAVLPFVSIGRDSSEAYVADGMTADLVNAVGRMRGVAAVVFHA